MAAAAGTGIPRKAPAAGEAIEALIRPRERAGDGVAAADLVAWAGIPKFVFSRSLVEKNWTS